MTPLNFILCSIITEKFVRFFIVLTIVTLKVRFFYIMCIYVTYYYKISLIPFEFGSESIPLSSSCSITRADLL